MFPTNGNQRSRVPPVQSDQFASEFRWNFSCQPVPFPIHFAQTGVRSDLLESLAAHESVRASRPANSTR